MQLQIDVLAKGFGFADARKLAKQMFREDLVLQDFTPAQERIWANMHQLLREAVKPFARVDTRKWPTELLEYGQLASGGLPDVEKAIAPFIKHVAKQKGPDGQAVGDAKAAEILRGTFASINGLLASDLGNAHSVTPAMKFLNLLAGNVMGAYLQSDHFKEQIANNVDFKIPMAGAGAMAAFRSHYFSFMDEKAIAYFCTPMPTPVDDALLGAMREKLFNMHFPNDYAALQAKKDKSTAAMLKHLSQDDYTKVRAAIAANLLNKEAVQKILTGAGVPAEQAEKFVAAHIGVNRLPINHRVTSKTDRIRKTIKGFFFSFTDGFLPKGLDKGDDRVRHGLFNAMLVRGKTPETLAVQVSRLLRGVLGKKHGWPVKTGVAPTPPTRPNWQRPSAASAPAQTGL